MKIYAVIDTNVIVSALLSRHYDSATAKILNYLFDRVLIPVYNDAFCTLWQEVSLFIFDFLIEILQSVKKCINLTD